MGKVWFVGAGPGDAELITVKGMRLLNEAGAILYAGSLVSEAVLKWAPKEAEVADSKGMTLEEINDWLLSRAQKHQTVIRLQTGDPSLYGALVEMARPLLDQNIEIAVVPGVSSAMAGINPCKIRHWMIRNLIPVSMCFFWITLNSLF